MKIAADTVVATVAVRPADMAAAILHTAEDTAGPRRLQHTVAAMVVAMAVAVAAGTAVADTAAAAEVEDTRRSNITAPRRRITALRAMRTTGRVVTMAGRRRHVSVEVGVNAAGQSVAATETVNAATVAAVVSAPQSASTNAMHHHPVATHEVTRRTRGRPWCGENRNM